MLKTTLAFCVFLSFVFGIQAIACYHRGLGDSKRMLEKLLGLYLKGCEET